MEYVAHADRDGLETYVDEVSAPSNFSIFWEMEQDPTMRLAGIPIESMFYLVGNAVIARGLFRYTAAAGLAPCVSVFPSATVKKRASTLTSNPPSSANSLKWRNQTFRATGCRAGQGIRRRRRLVEFGRPKCDSSP
jgi:hypothetical protein